MWLASARIEGLRSAPLVEREELERVHGEPRGPDAAALADGIALAAAFLVPARAAATLAALDVALDTTTTLLDESVLDEVEALDPHGVRALVGDAPTRSVTVELDLTLDPPTFRTLRDRAARDPALLAALGTGAGVRLRIGWLFNRAGTHATTAALAVQVGDERFPTSAVDRPPWLLDLLDRVGRAIHRLPPHQSEEVLAQALHAAARSPDTDVRAACARACDALAAAPFSLGRLELVEAAPGRLRLAFGPSLAPLRTAGPGALEAVALVHAALVTRPDVLVADAPADPAWRAWLGERTTGADATLEQVLLLGGP